MRCWTSDGTLAGTERVFDLIDASSNADRLIVAEDRLFFRAYSPDLGVEPWVTEGTEPSTIGLDLVPGPEYYTSNNADAFGRDCCLALMAARGS